MAVELHRAAFVDPYGGMAALAARVLDTPAHPEESFADDPLRMLRAARFVSQLGFTPAPRVVAAMTGDGGRDRPDHRRAGAGRAVQAAAAATYPERGIELLVDTGLADHVLPELPAMRLEIDEHHQHKDVYQHSLVVLRPGDRPGDRTARTWCCGWPRCCTTSASRRPAGSRRAAASASTTTRWSARRLVRKRLRALKYTKEIIEDVAAAGVPAPALPRLRQGRVDRLGGAPLRHRRRAAAAPAAQAGARRLHHPQPAQGAALQRSYDELEERIARIAADEDLARVRPDLDGNEIMRLLGVPPGPLVGQAWTFLKDLRLDRGPLEHDEAVAELFAWAREQGVDVPD